MSVGIPRKDEDLPSWREDVTELVNTLPDTVNGRVTTTNGTGTVILSLPLIANCTYLYTWTVVARQSAGSGTVGDGAAYQGATAWHLVGSTATEIGTSIQPLIVEDDTNWGVAVAGSGNRVEWTVTGAASKTIGWRIDVAARRLAV